MATGTGSLSPDGLAQGATISAAVHTRRSQLPRSSHTRATRPLVQAVDKFLRDDRTSGPPLLATPGLCKIATSTGR